MRHWFEHILFHLRAAPARPAIVLEDRVVTAEMLQSAINSCASRLDALSLPEGAAVAVHLGNPIRHITLCLALYRIGRISISLADGLGAVARPHFGVVLCDVASRAENASAPHIEVGDDWFAMAEQGQGRRPAGFANDADICRIGLTSGTTGAPKAVSYSVEEVGRRIAEKIFPAGMADSVERVLCLPGLSANYGFTSALAALVAGRTLCIADSPAQAVRMIELNGIDFALVSTEQLLALARVARVTSAGMTSLRTVVVGGSVASRALLEAATTYVCKDVRCRYGASEAGMMAQAGARDVLTHPGLAGHVVPGLDVAIVDANGRRVPSGEAGRIVVRQASQGSDLATEPIVETGWADLGDVGWLDAEGRLFVSGRAIEGDRPLPMVSPTVEAEHAVLLGSDVGGAAATSSPASAGQDRELWIALLNRRGNSDAALRTILKSRGIDNAVSFFDVVSIPTGVNGKVDRARLRQQLATMPATKR